MFVRTQVLCRVSDVVSVSKMHYFSTSKVLLLILQDTLSLPIKSSQCDWRDVGHRCFSLLPLSKHEINLQSLLKILCSPLGSLAPIVYLLIQILRRFSPCRHLLIQILGEHHLTHPVARPGFYPAARRCF
jgi:hypothetical protein